MEKALRGSSTKADTLPVPRDDVPRSVPTYSGESAVPTMVKASVRRASA